MTNLEVICVPQTEQESTFILNNAIKGRKFLFFTLGDEPTDGEQWKIDQGISILISLGIDNRLPEEF